MTMVEMATAKTVVAVRVAGMSSRKARLDMSYGARAVRRIGKGRCRVFLRPSLGVETIFMVVSDPGVSPTVRVVLRGKKGAQQIYALDVELLVLSDFDVAGAMRGEKVAPLRAKHVDRSFHLQGVVQ